jgi:hypothetical protein
MNVATRSRWESLALLLMLIGACAAQIRSAAHTDVEPGVSVRISTSGTRFHTGEDILLQVEIWNEGKENLFVHKEISTTSNALSKLALTTHKGGKALGPSFFVTADCFCAERSSYPPLATELPRYWVAVPPQHFYGGQVVMQASEFQQLKVPGQYRIQGRYSSRGFLAQDINNPLAHYADELKTLPYPAWVGEVDSNSITITIER